MMDNWRRKGDNDRKEIQRNGSFSKKPPMDSLQTTNAPVPLWEKKFCAIIGSVPWRKLLDTKKYMHLYDDVVQWNDSAGEEAFNNAKYRFWADINGLPCDISLPDPNIHIDEIDWNSEIDPELILDLDRNPVVTSNEDDVPVHGNLLLLDQPVPCSGWGDEEQEVAKCDDSALNNVNAWENSCPQNNQNTNENGWGQCWNNYNTWGSDNWGNKNHDSQNFGSDSWGNKNYDTQNFGSDNWGNRNYESQNFDGGRTRFGIRETRDWSHRNEEVADGWHMSRYKTSRFHVDDYQMEQGWRSGGKWRKPGNHVNDQWKINSCQPLNRGSSGRARNSRNWNNQIA